MNHNLEKIRLTFIITDLGLGGAEIMLLRLLQRINREIFECKVISISADGVIGERIRVIGIPVLILGMKPESPNPFLFFKLIGWLVNDKPQLIQTWLYHADLLGGLAGWLLGIPVIWNIHNATLHPDGKRRTGRVVKLLAWLSHFLPKRIVSCSLTAKEKHIGLGYPANKFEIIPNGFDTSLYQPDPKAGVSLRGELGLDPSSMLVGNVARFDPQKDHHTLIMAASLLVTRLPDVKFVLCGDGMTQDNPDLAGWINEVGLQTSFYLLGRREDIPRIMAGVGGVASSSAGEAFPTVLGEAMACGTACVATDVGDSSLIVGDTGLIVPAGDPKKLAEALYNFLTGSQAEKHDMGLNARKRIIGQFNLPDIVSKYEASFLQVLGR